MEHKEETKSSRDEGTADADLLDCDSHLMMAVKVLKSVEMTKIILTTTWTKQSFCLSWKEVELSSREMIHMFSGRDITVARPDNHYDDDDDDMMMKMSTESWLRTQCLWNFLRCWGLNWQDTANCVNSKKGFFKCIALTRFSTAPAAFDTWQTWNPQTEDKKLVEYWHVRLGSDYSEGKTKLGNADQNPYEKRRTHQHCKYFRGQHASYTFQVQVSTSPCPNLKLYKVQKEDNLWIIS